MSGDTNSQSCHRRALGKLARRKYVDLDENKNQLKRVLTVMDLTFLGIGSTIGVGVYVLAGAVARNDAGPAVVLSFLIAAVSSILAGLCYAEFGARVPKAGSAYVYTYVCLGEVLAFVVGWNLIMEYMIGVASVAKGFSTHLDALLNGTMEKAFKEYLPMGSGEHLSTHFDAFAFFVTMVITCILAFGVKESSLFNAIFTSLKLLVVIFIIIVGSMYAKPSYWAIDPSTVNRSALQQESGGKIGELGSGGFAPFGFAGIMRGAATCFYAFVGFDCIATTGEEAKNPKRAIPLAFLLCLIFVTAAYIGISTVLTMMVPYYLQDEHAPLPEAFHYVDFETGKWIASIGALVGFSASLLGTMFPLPRVIYAMASDGLLFKFMAKVHPKTQTPVIATMLSGVLGATLAGIFELDALVDMMSIGTLTAYTCVAIGVLILRYRVDEEESDTKFNGAHSLDGGKSARATYINQIWNNSKSSRPTKESSAYTGWIVLVYSIFAVILCTLGTFAADQLLDLKISYVVGTAFAGILLILILISLSLQPTSNADLSFKVPLVPLIPGLSIVVNIFLICQLSGPTWIRFCVWLLVGLLIYLFCWFSGSADKAYAENQASKAAAKSNIKVVVTNDSNGEQVANTAF